jgi:1,3-beta-glucan synthase component.
VRILIRIWQVRILGFKEHIFTDVDGIVGRSGALSEYVFGTIVQRVMYVLLRARLHYGHPDIFCHAFVQVTSW